MTSGGDGLILADADYIIQDASRVMPRASVYIRDMRIEDLGPPEDIAARHQRASVVECNGWILHPGLVNAHNHMYQVMFRGLGKDFTLEQWLTNLTYALTPSLSAEDHYDAVLLACLDAARNGTTSIIDMPTHHARHYAAESLQAMRDAGLRGAVARGFSDRSTIDEREAQAIDRELAQAEAFLAEHRDEDLVRPWLGPSGFHAASPKLLQELKRLSAASRVGFHIHLGESRASLERAAGAGYEGEVAWAHGLKMLDSATSIAHAVWVSERETEILRDTEATVVHNPTSNQLLCSGIAPIMRYLASGVRVALGTDGPASNDSLDVFSEMKHAVLAQRGSTLQPQALTARDVFSMATEGGAQALGIADLGRIAPGFLADIVAVDAASNLSLLPLHEPVEALVYCAVGRDVRLTVVGGQVIYTDGGFSQIDVGALVERCRKRADILSEQYARRR